MRVIAGASTFNALFSSRGNGIQTAGLRGSFIDESDDIINRQSSPGAQRLRVGITHEKRRPVVHQQTLHSAGTEDVGCFVASSKKGALKLPPWCRQSAEIASGCLARSQQLFSLKNRLSRHQKPIKSTLTFHKDIEINGKLPPSPNSLSLPAGLPPSSNFIVDPGSARAKFDTLRPQRFVEVEEAAKTIIVLLYKQVE
ncbi:hypothetical protein DAPPUDRAFT_113526 [Daphnia pulex]|uniref:Uncharacterized protein n=1 Tax=Daphnia pulex TaxID=6669 RepID=E9HF89_DAPPU|nr:hypothetical protein DAPPUDRAFT_113526 [Daphnia pulex]|eukprot:EFX69603.1 hypothetical protein DAPPUDRAFT_113526 [Daphnia pulex]